MNSPTFTLALENDSWYWQYVVPFVDFCIQNQGQDITIIVCQESTCLATVKLYEILDRYTFKSVKIITSNAVEHHPRYTIVNGSWYHWLRKANTFKEQEYPWNRRQIFGCFYARPSASRLGIASYLHQHYPEKSLLQLKFDCSTEDSRFLFDLQKLFAWDIDSCGRLDNLIKNSPPQQQQDAYDYSTGTYDYNHPINSLYSNIFVDIVVEANSIGNSFYPTEKIARAILCKRPFIVMSSGHYLQYLTQMGFKTFSDFWNEDYDYYAGKDRYLAILNLIDTLANLSIDELDQLNIRIAHTVEYNYQLLRSQRFKKSIKRVKSTFE